MTGVPATQLGFVTAVKTSLFTATKNAPPGKVPRGGIAHTLLVEGLKTLLAEGVAARVFVVGLHNIDRSV